MSSHKVTKQFTTILAAAGALVTEADADALLVLLDGSTDWQKLRQAIPSAVTKSLLRPIRTPISLGPRNPD